ncbi:MAG: SufE family protein, partial [Paludibacteraceae bacterium]|nr:SufE family protein [Paludibacteraceae bacterium]
DNGHVIFAGDSDAVIVKGILALLLHVVNDHTPQEIIETDLYFINEIGLKEHLSPTRSNGLLAMVKQIKFYAIAFNR